ncbi:ribonuclease HIII [Phorcysia thermohydrogeniphila]|uniref:Ribonuclease n=1 Tax=Phorcysia thermohydrogeniphila TaxID=936138 RepID=A0A4R1GK08_9BACT|nr:ribonuclease HIII [Phorcysia thermohydrogeniphila]TCK06329.1 ribonuclease HIII [Phorcysia thermohydrogeniphila]
MKLERKKIEKVVNELLSEGAIHEEPPAYALYRLRLDDGIVTIYESGSVVFGGKDGEKLKKRFLELLFKEIDLSPRIGCDEAGKGEFVGPLVVSCIYANEDCIKKLLSLDVKDSKKLPNKKLKEMAEEIKKHCHGYVKVLMPENYNRLYKKYGNVNRMLEDIYKEVIGKLLEKYKVKRVIVDKFSERIENILKENFPNVEFKVVPKAESDPVVAAASIVAKAERLRKMEDLSKLLGFPLPEGNKENRELLSKIPPELRYKFVKEHFKVNGE